MPMSPEIASALSSAIASIITALVAMIVRYIEKRPLDEKIQTLQSQVDTTQPTQPANDEPSQSH